MLKSTNLLIEDRDAVRKRSLKSQIAEKLITMISNNMIAIGDSLPSERDLAKTYEVSRETIRGSLKILSEKNIIHMEKGFRAKVITGSTQTQQHDYFSSDLHEFNALTVAETRTVVEVAILRSAAINISDDSICKLAKMLKVQEGLLKDPVAFQISDKEFHTLIYNAGRNELLAQIAKDVYSYALEYRNVALKEELSTVRSLREHQQIYRALISHDPDAAERAITAHVDSIFKSTLMMQKKESE